ncbi:hypothetical protein Acr_00g0104040 [Actinidia rufa]|uniref:Mannan endo-1,4-beta-mannosidase n=1 Tax=Actinidia rufa TaxID=165716 RepID=A0A7J0E2I4_9ERIC|nr:hypothetical protein Acr_00g0104040 [Actinidia rufa]
MTKKLLSICFFSSFLIYFAYGKADSGDFRVRGVNLGGWLIVEGWITPSLFDGIPNKDLLDGTFIQLKSITSEKYICPEKSGQRVVLTDQKGKSESILRLWRINETSFNFRLENKKFLGLDTAGSHIVSVSTAPTASETFEILRHHHQSSRVRIKASNGFFLQVNKERVIAHSGGNGGWGDDDPTVFEIEIRRQLDGEFQVTNGYGPRAPKIMSRISSSCRATEINTVRIPVGWWIASEPTPPAPYVGGSLKHLDKAFSWAQKYEMKVIVDLHAAPGSQTGSTVSSSRDGFMEWGQTDQNIQDTVAVIDFLTGRYAKHPSLYAVELLNEPLMPDVSLDTLTNYYRAGYNAVRKHSSTAYVLFSNRLGYNPADPRELLPLSTELKGSVIDVHYYHLFMEIFKTMNYQQNLDFLYKNVSAELNQLTLPKGPLIFVGEWATEWATATLDNPNYSKASKEDYQKFAKVQLEVYGRATFGWAYWNLKCHIPHFSLEWMIKNDYIKAIDGHGVKSGVSSITYWKPSDMVMKFLKLSPKPNNWFGKDFRYVSADASEKSNERFMVLGTDINGYRSIQDCKIHGLVRVLLLQVDLLLPLSLPLASRVN